MQFFVLVKRILALASSAIALYVVVGCWMFGPWCYSYVYEGEFKDPQNTFDALKVLCEQYFWLIVLMFVAVLLAVLLGSTWSVRLFRVLDGFGWRITFTAVWLVALALAVGRHVRLELLLAFPHPDRAMFPGDLNAAVSEQN
jgi:hypothetical protein